MINTKEQTIINSIKGIRKRTCVFIRINPDEYTDTLKNHLKSC